jgi:hypothetical protein
MVHVGLREGDVIQRAFAAVLLCLALLPGCGYRRPALVQPQALVTLDGEPVAEADVMLVPTGSGRAVKGVSDQNGRIAFSTYGAADGVPPGSYKAIVTKRELTKRGARKLAASRERSAADDNGSPNAMIELQDDDYRSLLPSCYAAVDTTDLMVTVDRGSRQVTLALESKKPPK